MTSVNLFSDSMTSLVLKTLVKSIYGKIWMDHPLLILP